MTGQRRRVVLVRGAALDELGANVNLDAKNRDLPETSDKP